MPVTLRSLLESPQFRLRLASNRAVLQDGALDREISWVHSSDLDDPTPFITAGQVLLTDGTQFPVDVDASRRAGGFTDVYVERLAAHGVTALGFATQVVHGRLPEVLREACERHRLPVFEVPERIPFIAIIQHVASVKSRDEHARSDWLISAHRSIAKAARRTAALPAILGELGRLVNGWVLLFEASGEAVRAVQDHAVPPGAEAMVGRHLRSTSVPRRTTNWMLDLDVGPIMMQTVGPRNQPYAVLAIGGVDVVDVAARELIGSVIALAGVALHQRHLLRDAELAVRSTAMELLRAGDAVAAARLARPLGLHMPSGSIVVASTTLPAGTPNGADKFIAQLTAQKRTLFSVQGSSVVIVAEESAMEAVAAVVDRSGFQTGWSATRPVDELRSAIDEAGRMLALGIRRNMRTMSPADADREGYLAFVDDGDARLYVDRTLGELARVDARLGSQLLESVRVWMAHDCAWQSSAKALGIHRHSMRNRIDAAGDALGLDLDSMPGRARLWTALAIDERRPSVYLSSGGSRG